MKVIYKCQYCEETFDQDTKCLNHELTHKVDSKGELYTSLRVVGHICSSTDCTVNGIPACPFYITGIDSHCAFKSNPDKWEIDELERTASK